MAAGGTARRSPAYSAIMQPWLNPASARAEPGRPSRASSGIEEAVQRAARRQRAGRHHAPAGGPAG